MELALGLLVLVVFSLIGWYFQIGFWDRDRRTSAAMKRRRH